MKVTTAAEMSAIDRATSQQHGVDSLTLMENAGSAVADLARAHWPAANRITVVCGKGNNGGDGLVAARHLHAAGKVVEVLLLGAAEGLKPDAASMLARLPFRPALLTSAEEVAREHACSLTGADLIVDAIYGTGYKQREDSPRKQDLAEAAIAAINAASAPVLSVDLPSGTDADVTSSAAEADALVCRSSAVITFTAPKLAHMLAPLHAGSIVVAPIGTPDAAVISTQNIHAVTPNEVSQLFAPRALDSNKGRFGHVLVTAGSYGKSGAAAMCWNGGLARGRGTSDGGNAGSCASDRSGICAGVDDRTAR